MNPFAEHIPDSLFRAIHSDWILQVSPPVGTSFQEIGSGSFTEMSPESLLEDFLRDDRSHALAAILGTTGTGKSHLVHWIRLNIRPDKEKRLVLVVKKSGTSLRAIVEMIIEELDPDERQGFRDTLNRAGEGTATRDGQKQQLLNDLAFAIREDAPRDPSSELEAELIAQLPNLFQDPHMREGHFLRDDTIIADVVDHIFARSNAADRPENRRQFSEEDLPLGGADYANASLNARNAMMVIDLDPALNRPLAVEIINRNLDKAIARTLSFSGDRVEELMSRLRRHLKRQGRELILLVEEFARLQGIDRALLQAITTQGDDEHCKMRSAIAVTTGFFESVAETAYMRTTHIVDMDRSAGRAEGRGVTTETLSAFAARYLNAVRLGLKRIEDWNKAAVAGDSPPSKCSTCPHITECHAAFGAVDNYGLYPFTSRALWMMATRADRAMPESLNPRILQNNVLVEVLDTFAPSIQVGEFPPHRLLDKFGSDRTLSLTDLTRLKSVNPQAYDRWTSALELYDGSGKIVNLPSAILDAFSIPPIPGAAEGDPDTALHDPSPTVAVTPTPTRAASREDMLIEQWINGAGLDQTIANTLRNLIFAAVADAIDWDMLGLERTSFMGRTGRAFQVNSISFLRQTTQARTYAPVQLEILGNKDDALLVGPALQGLIRASKNGFRWDFDDGDTMLAALADCLDGWTASVEGQLRAMCVPAPNWSQSAAALHLLCVGAALANKIKPDSTVADMVDGAFSNWLMDSQASSSELKAVFEKIVRQRERLVSVARAQISSMKGGQTGAMLRPDRYLDQIRAFHRAKWRLNLEPVDEKLSDFSVVAKLYREIQSALEAAVRAEWDLRRQWLNDMETSFGPEATRASILQTLTEAREAAVSGGIPAGNTSGPLRDLLERFKAVLFDDALSAARAVAKVDDPMAALPHFGRGRRNAVDTANELKAAATAFVDAVEHNLSAFGGDQQARQAASADSLAKISTALNDIERDLDTLSESGEAPANAA